MATAVFTAGASSFSRSRSFDLLSAATTSLSVRASSSYDRLCEATSPLVHAAQRNLDALEVPSFIRRPYILTSYRANHDLRSCLVSLLEWHNETMNVWSHLLGCILFLAILGYVSSYELLLPPAAAALERWPLYVFILSALGCLGASAVYHLFGTANARWYGPLAAVDYVGIVGLIVGSCTPVVWYAHGERHHTERSLYLGAIGLLGACVILGSLTGRLSRCGEVPRIALFVLLAFAGVAALLHAAYVHGLSERHVALMIGVAKMGLTYGLGVAIYATNFPESFARGSRMFDRVGSSHQWWHACVLLAATCHFRTVFRLWEATAALAAEAGGGGGGLGAAELHTVLSPIAGGCAWPTRALEL